MTNPVMIKGNKLGVTLVLDSELPYPKLCDRIRMKFKESAKFFENSSQMAITFEGRELSNEEQAHIIEIINDACNLNISYILEKDEILEQVLAAKLAERGETEAEGKEEKEEKQPADKKKESGLGAKDKKKGKEPVIPITAKSKLQETKPAAEKDNVDIVPKHAPKDMVGSIDNQTSNMGAAMEVNDDLGHFYRGTLRSGQSIEFASSIVVIGDVNPGARVIAKGNIIVIGSLKGAAFAGVNGSQNAFIIALDMDPMQLRIGDLYARSPDSKGFLKKKRQPSREMQIAFVENNNIYIEPINRAVLNRSIQ